MNLLKDLITMLVKEEAENRQASVLFVQNEEGKILTVSRKNDSTKIGLPGGKVDPGETPEQAAVRELKEECGLSATNLKHVFVYQDVGCFRTHTFTCDVKGTISTDEVGVIRWVEPKFLIDPEYSPYVTYNKLLFKKLGVET